MFNKYFLLLLLGFFSTHALAEPVVYCSEGYGAYVMKEINILLKKHNNNDHVSAPVLVPLSDNRVVVCVTVNVFEEIKRN
jgi:hypothetical protein